MSITAPAWHVTQHATIGGSTFEKHTTLHVVQSRFDVAVIGFLKINNRPDWTSSLHKLGMSSSQIPHLSTFRSTASSKARSRLRRPPRDGDVRAEEEEEDGGGGGGGAAKDKIVQQTDRDASISRMSAVERGYLDDPFASQFVAEKETSERRYPIINRGTFVRTFAIDRLVQKFLAGVSSRGKKQIISLGAGSDTRYFRLMASRPSSPVVYHELDFPANTVQKIKAIKRSSSLWSLLHDPLVTNDDPSSLQIADDFSSLSSPTYNIHPIDLRTLNRTAAWPDVLLPNLDPALPTLLLSECCLIYLTPTDADSILRFFSTHLIPAPTPLGIILYEPIRPHDPFGRVMVANLARRGIVMQTLHRYSTLARQILRLTSLLSSSSSSSPPTAAAAAADVDFIFETWLSPQEKDRIQTLELLDEVEEWRMLARHYCVVWAWRDDPTTTNTATNSGSGGGHAHAHDGPAGLVGRQEESGKGYEAVFQKWKEDVIGQTITDDDDDDG